MCRICNLVESHVRLLGVDLYIFGFGADGVLTKVHVGADDAKRMHQFRVANIEFATHIIKRTL